MKRKYLWMVRRAYRALRHPKLRHREWWKKLTRPLFERRLWKPCRDTVAVGLAIGLFFGLIPLIPQSLFAAIAASGDVNVNSIAPGIAAALAATVAGLAVAIPALFGYNWLNTKIKEINADQRVFVDEFVTRVAEHYA